MTGVRHWTPRASNCRSGSHRSATPSPVSNKKKSRASTEALAADSHPGATTHGSAVAPHQGGLWTGVSGGSHLGQSRAADGRPGTGNLSGLDRADAGAESKLRRTEYSHRSFRGDHRELCAWVVSVL